MTNPKVSAVALPGHQTPAAGFDQPFEMLLACHERVQRSLRLLLRLIDRAAGHGIDEAVRQACADVLRYFDLAAPLHHDDEERHVFPALTGRVDAKIAATVERLRAEHIAMAAAWLALRPALQAWRDGGGDSDPPLVSVEVVRALAKAFAQSYGEHIQLEEELIYPAARAWLDDSALASMGADMRARRMSG